MSGWFRRHLARPQAGIGRRFRGPPTSPKSGIGAALTALLF
jgi:hypothetical protein